MIARILALATLLFLSACGGGGSGGGGSSPPPSGTAPPSGLSYSAPPAYIVGQEVTPLQPTVTGTVSSYSIAPSLPGGLSMNTTTGVISGTPTSAHASTAHTITASNSGGSTTATVTITVNTAAAGISYGTIELKLTTGVPVEATPSNPAGTATWSIAPPLPAGLSFSETDGSITGVPTEVAAPTTHVVTAGTESLELTVSVDSGVLFENGHSDRIHQLLRDGSRLLSVDYGGRWVLWNTEEGKSLASGVVPGCGLNFCDTPGALIGPTLVLRTSTGVQLRSSSDGALLANLIISPYWWKLAADGSYFVASDAAGLTVWSPAGEVLISRTGDYSTARAYAAADEIRFVRGPASANQVEIILMPTGSTVNGPTFLGEFESWFLDGERFITKAGSTVRIYSKDGTQEDSKSLVSTNGLAGQGQWFWTHDPNFAVPGTGTFRIYAVNGSATPTTLGADEVIASGTTIGLTLENDPTVTLLDISSPTLAQTSHTTPATNIDAYAATSTSDWHVGASLGQVFNLSGPGNTPSYLAIGRIRALVGRANRVVIATSLGDLRFFDATTGVEEGRIAFPATRLAISDDGAVLMAGLEQTLDHTVKIFSLPSGAELETRPYPGSTGFPNDLSLSGSGTLLGEVFDWNPSMRTVTSLVDGAVIWNDTAITSGATVTGETPVRISPDGTLIAAPDRPRNVDCITNIFLDGAPTGSATGWAVGWIDNDRLLVNRYTNNFLQPPRYSAAVIVDSTGDPIASPPLPQMRTFQTVSPDSIYSPENNEIYSLTATTPTAEVIWKTTSRPSPAPRSGAVVGGRVIFTGDGVVRTEPY